MDGTSTRSFSHAYRLHVEPSSATHRSPSSETGEEPQACIKSNDCLFKRLTSVGPGCLTSKAKKVTIRFYDMRRTSGAFSAERSLDGFLFSCLSVSTD